MAAEIANLELMISQAKKLQNFLLSVASVTTSTAEQQCSRLSYPHPLTDMSPSTLSLIFQYLDWLDCAKVCRVCFSFSLVVRSRSFQAMIYRQRTVSLNAGKSADGAPDAPEEAEARKPDYSQLTKEQILLETKKANAVITYLSEKFASQKRRNELLEAEMGKAKTNLRIQTQLSKKTAARARQLEDIPQFESAADVQATVERERLAEQQQIQCLQGELDRCQGKKEELTHHKRLLKRELKRLRQKVESDQALVVVHEKTMKKISKYFKEMHAPRIEAMEPDVKCE